MVCIDKTEAQALIAKIKALRKVAEKANQQAPGPWEDTNGDVWRERETRDGSEQELVAQSSVVCAGFISCHNPAAMIALYDEMLKVLEHKEDGK